MSVADQDLNYACCRGDPDGQQSLMMGCGESGGRNTLAAINLLLMAASLMLIGVGAGLLGFYRIHLLEIVSVHFLVVPVLMVINIARDQIAPIKG